MVPEESKSENESSRGDKPQARLGPRRGGGPRRGRGRGRRGQKPTQSGEQEPSRAPAPEPAQAEDVEQAAPAKPQDPIAIEEVPRQDIETPVTAAPSDTDEAEAEASHAEAFDDDVPFPEQPPLYEEPTSRLPERRPHYHDKPYSHRQPPPAAKEKTALTEAIQQVNEVIQTLKDSLDDLDEVLETLELAERQKNFDEQEIENLKRSLRMLQRPKEQGRGPR